jgi:hypothetical protein
MSWRQQKSRERKAAAPGSRKFFGLIVKDADRAAWQICDDLSEFKQARPRPWRWPGAVSKKLRRFYADKRSAERKRITELERMQLRTPAVNS